MKKCKVHNCENPAAALGLCHAHWARQAKNGDAQVDKPLRPRGKPKPKCIVICCERQAAAHSHSLCKAHYMRYKRHGYLVNSPIGYVLPTKTNGFIDRTPIEDDHSATWFHYGVERICEEHSARLERAEDEVAKELANKWMMEKIILLAKAAAKRLEKMDAAKANPKTAAKAK